jgi:hypothetical protein
MSKSFDDFQAGHRRHAILDLLLQATAATLNEVVMQHMLATPPQAFPVAGDVLRDDLRYLADHALLKIDYDAPAWVATLLKRGGEVAKGLLECPGVAKPGLQ